MSVTYTYMHDIYNIYYLVAVLNGKSVCKECVISRAARAVADLLDFLVVLEQLQPGAGAERVAAAEAAPT